MSIQKYKALLMTVETGSITAAAQKLGYTQSAVSKMIQDLEQEWNMELLSRSRKGIELTSEGLTVIPAVRDIISDYENLQFSLASAHGLKQGTLRLGSFASVSATVLPEILKSFRSKYPGIQIQLRAGEYGEISEDLRKGSLDCGFLGEDEAAGFYSIPVFKDCLVAVVPKGHTMADAEVYPVEMLPKESFISLREKRDYDFAQFFDEQNIRPAVSYEVESDLTLLSMVENGLGVSLVYDMILKPGRFDVVRLPLDRTKERTVLLSARRGARNSPVLSLFMDHVSEYSKENGFV